MHGVQIFIICPGHFLVFFLVSGSHNPSSRCRSIAGAEDKTVSKSNCIALAEQVIAVCGRDELRMKGEGKKEMKERELGEEC